MRDNKNNFFVIHEIANKISTSFHNNQTHQCLIQSVIDFLLLEKMNCSYFLSQKWILGASEDSR